MSQMHTWRLQDVAGLDPRLVGQKAHRLGILLSAGLLVPPGFVVPTTVMRTVLDAAGVDCEAPPADLDDADLCRRARRALLDDPLPDNVAGPLDGAIADWVGAAGIAHERALIVRSSAPAEDGANGSFAGQYRSLACDPNPAAVLAAVRSCWASAWEPQVAEYARVRNNALVAADSRLVAVIVQELLPAETSGILFTLNPLTGREEEMLVESVWGLGEALAGGRVTPDRFVIHTWEDRSLRVTVADKPVMLVRDDSQTTEREVPPGRRDEPSLEPEQLFCLRRLGHRVQRALGYPQDIEWVYGGGEFHLVQTRPITAFTFAPDTGQWTSANFREVMPGFASFLSQSSSFHHDFSRSMEEVVRRIRLWRPEDEGTVWSKTIFGHGYWNVGATKRIMSRLPGYRERDFDRTVGIEPTYEGDGATTGFTPGSLWQGIPTLLALNRQYRRVLAEAGDYCREFDAAEPGWDGVDPAALDDGALGQWVKRGLDIHWRVNRWALLISFLSTQAQDDFHRVLDKLNRRLPPGEEPVSEARLLTGLSGMATARPLTELWDLSRRAATDPEVAALIREAPVAELESRLRQHPRGAGFWQEFEAFLHRCRYMAQVDEDLACPRWCEDPTIPLVVLQRYVTEGEGADPAGQLEAQRRVREAESRRAVGLAAGRLGRLVPWRVSGFESQYDLVRRLCWWREETRVYLSRGRYHCRRFLVEQGRRWAAAGLTTEPDDIFWMARSEVIDLVGGRTDWSEVTEQVARRRALTELYRDFEPPLAISPGTPPPETASRLDGVYLGVGCSAGVATAPCCVVESLEEAGRLKAGQILVAPYANPGWTPLFQLVSGLVLEEGGLLSHCAVVAREYGVPAVLQIKNCTRTFRDGQVLRVDGLRGTVEVVN